jgi:hypothetical protein
MRSLRAELDYTVVVTPDGTRHARLRGVPVLLCGEGPGTGAHEERERGEFDCPECIREAELRGDDRAIGVVDA